MSPKSPKNEKTIAINIFAEPPTEHGFRTSAAEIARWIKGYGVEVKSFCRKRKEGSDSVMDDCIHVVLANEESFKKTSMLQNMKIPSLMNKDMKSIKIVLDSPGYVEIPDSYDSNMATSAPQTLGEDRGLGKPTFNEVNSENKYNRYDNKGKGKGNDMQNRGG